MIVFRRALIVVVALGAVLLIARTGDFGGDTAPPPARDWGFAGPFGRFDRAAAQRGFQVYAEACANCHSMKYLHYRDLSGIGLSDAAIKTFAAGVTVPVGFDTQGNVVSKAATPASWFRSPFPNDDAAREVLNGALPPDLSLIVETYSNGPDYVYAVLTGYADPPAGVTLADGMSYNEYVPGHQIAMPRPLNDGQISYTDSTPSTVARNAQDVVTFLAWAAHPEMDERKHLGLGVVVYFLAMAGVTFALKRRIWADVH
jgi:ubiquinol-cytochrome c reductase cytochrome c1 subunit